MSAILRSIVAVLVGYVVFATSTLLAPISVLGGWLRARAS
jgi:hypothetical protein